ncbi:MAG: Rdx family protein [Anaerolineaceae bacterium]
MIKKLSIEYCVPCQYEKDAKTLAAIIQEQFGLNEENILFIPSKKIGTFEVSVDGNLIYSKTQSGKLPTPEKIINLIFLQPEG